MNIKDKESASEEDKDEPTVNLSKDAIHNFIKHCSVLVADMILKEKNVNKRERKAIIKEAQEHVYEVILLINLLNYRTNHIFIFERKSNFRALFYLINW